MPTIQECLLKTLDNLGKEKLDRFQWHLKKNFDCISVVEIESANSLKTVDIMEARFTPEGAVKVTLDILRKMDENHLAQLLEKDAGSAAQMNSVDLNPQSGETGNAPVLTRSIIPAPVTVNFSSGAAGLQQYFCRTQMKVDPVVKFPSAGPGSPRCNGRDSEITQYACDLTLDPNTAHPSIFLSERNRKASHVSEKQPYPAHPERFDWQPQVLCRERLTGRHYWEVEWSMRMWVEIAVTYKGRRYKGADNDYRFGLDSRSWVLKCSRYSYLIKHQGNMTNIPVRSSSTRVGVYVDWSAGSLSFYSVSDTHTLTHLHTFNTTFTEPLYTGFLLQSGCSVALCEF